MTKTAPIHKMFLIEAIKRGWSATVYDNPEAATRCKNVQQLMDAVADVEQARVEFYGPRGKHIGNIGVVVEGPGQDPSETIYDYHVVPQIEEIMEALYKIYE